MPATFRELGAKEEDISALAAHLFTTRSGPLTGFMELSRKDVEAIYRLAL
jgi:alcohol dehydrogenase class IV